MIVVTLKINKQNFDLSFDENMTLNDVIIVLKESSNLSHGFNCNYWKSYLMEKTVSSYKSCKEEEIGSGDILEAVTRNE